MENRQQRPKFSPGPLNLLEKIEIKGHLKPGDRLNAAISLPSTSGTLVNLTKIAETQNIVVFVYPGDREGLRYGELFGCTPEACSFNTAMSDFKSLNTKVYGLSFQTTQRQQEFVKRENFKFEILSDAERKFHKLFGISQWQTKKELKDDFGYQPEIFAVRTTVIIKEGGQIHSIKEVSDIENHVKEVIEAIRGLKATNDLSLP